MNTKLKYKIGDTGRINVSAYNYKGLYSSEEIGKTIKIVEISCNEDGNYRVELTNCKNAEWTYTLQEEHIDIIEQFNPTNLKRFILTDQSILAWSKNNEQV